MEGVVTNIQRFSVHDGGGIRTVAFLKGCPFRCPWCCNPENLSARAEVSFKERLCIHCSAPGEDGLCVTPPDACPTGAKELLGHTWEAGELARTLMRDRTFFEESNGGVTLSGGECLAQADFSIAVLSACRELGVNTAVETTLALPLCDDRLDALARVTDTFLVDFKVADRDISLSVTGIDPSLRDRNLRALLAHGAHVIARMPIIPGFTDSPQNVGENANSLVALGIDRADVLPFHQLGEAKYASVRRAYGMADVPQLGEEDVAWVARRLEERGIRTVIHGE